LDEPFTGLDIDNIRLCASLICDVDVPVVAAIHSSEEIALLGDNVKILNI
jgi:ABC-type uncharacterized transport system ATPase subunit